MTKKVLPLFVLVTLAACLLSYKFGSAPVALAKARPNAQDIRAEAVCPLTLPAPPAEWVVHDFEVNPNIASVTKAGVTGVQHVADCISANGLVSGSGAADWSQLELLDGATVIMEWEFALPNKDNGMGQVSVCGLSVVGGVGNSMTLKFVNTANFAGESVNLVGHDAT